MRAQVRLGWLVVLPLLVVCREPEPRGAPALASATPLPAATGVALETWPRLTFVSALPDALLIRFELACDDAAIGVSVHRLASDAIVIDPDAQLPPAAHCVIGWPGAEGREALSFRTTTPRVAASVVYDPLDPGATAPFPDDQWSEPDPTSPTGRRLRRVPRSREGLAAIFDPLQSDLADADGFSPLAPIVFELSDPLDPHSAPATAAESLDELASVQLIDIDPLSPGFGQRAPFRLEGRSHASPDGLGEHAVLLFPSIPLRAGGQYGLLVTRRVRAAGRRPLRPSVAMAASLRPAREGDPPEIARVREGIAALLEVAEQELDPPIRRDDLALAIRFTVASLATLPDDMLSIREQIFARPRPAIRITDVEAATDASRPLAAVVHGRWLAPAWIDRQNQARDEDGRPRIVAEIELPFTLALPRRARAGPVPVVMYQHGNPGRAESEVPSPDRDPLLAAGFAVAGFTDVLNRFVPATGASPQAAVLAQVFALLTALMMNERVPDYWIETTAQQLAFVRALSGLGDLDVLPVGAPDGRPEIDVAAPLSYLGVSEGANLGPALLPYAPEIRAAVLVAGGARLAELMLHQETDTFLSVLPRIFPGVRPIDVFVALSLVQTAFDRQDAHNHARHLYREPLVLAHAPPDGTRRASVLLVEGIGDRLVPNHATESLAWQLGPLSQLEPVARRLPFLAAAAAPLRGNLGERDTGALVQWVPVGVAGLAPSPGCIPPAIAPLRAGEGHFCAQLARESLRMQASFLRSAQSGAAPTIDRPDPSAAGAADDLDGRAVDR